MMEKQFCLMLILIQGNIGEKQIQKLSEEMLRFQVGLIMKPNMQELMFQECCKKH